MTSNLGAEHLANQEEGADVEEVRGAVMETVRKFFRPEFLNRLDEILLFRRLGRAQMSGIVDIQLGNLRKLLAGRRMTLDLDSKAKEWLAERGYDPIYGARPLKRAIQTNLQNTLAEMILRGEIPDGASILATTNKEGIVFKIDAGGKGSQKTAA